MEEQREKIVAFKNRQKETRKNDRIKKAVCIIIAVCILLGLWVCRKQLLSDILYERIQILIAESASGAGYPYSLQGNSVQKSNFAVSRKNAVVLSDTSLNVISKKGSVVLSAQHNYISPALDSSSSRFIIYDLGNKKYRIESVNGTVTQADTDGKILAAAIADSGKYAVATFADNCASSLKVYTPSGKLQYEYSFATGYVTCLDIDESGTKGAAAVTYSKGGEIASALYVFDFDKAQPAAVYEYEDILFISMFHSGGKIVGVSDGKFVFIDAQTLEKSEVDLNGAMLRAFDCCSGSFIAAYDVYSGAAENYLKVYTNSGEEKISLKLNQKITDTAVFGNTFAVLSGEKVDAYDIDTGEFIGQYEAGSNAAGIEFSSAQELYVLGYSEIAKIDIG